MFRFRFRFEQTNELIVVTIMAPSADVLAVFMILTMDAESNGMGEQPNEVAERTTGVNRPERCIVVRKGGEECRSERPNRAFAPATGYAPIEGCLLF